MIAMPLSEHELLEAGDCAILAARVVALHTHWRARAGGRFHSLGLAAYLDAVEDRAAYGAAAQRDNAMLRAHFSDLYAHLSAFFGALLGGSVAFDERSALPGFHIFARSGGGDERPSLRAHFDMQWQAAYPGCRPAATLSFTLPIALPAAGASLALWPARNTGDDATAHAGIPAILERAPQILDYALGRIVVHDGLQLHAIGPLPASSGTRITLQGHGVHLDGRWLLYW